MVIKEMWQAMSWRRRIVVSLVAAYLCLLVGSTLVRWIGLSLYADQWLAFDSQEYYQTKTFPDGVRFVYPKAWYLNVSEKGPPANAGRFRRFSLTRPKLPFSTYSKILVHWKRIEVTASLDDVADWYIHEVARGIRYEELLQSRSTFQQTVIGRGHYAALTQDYRNFGMSPFTLTPDPLERVVLLKVGDEAFAFVLKTSDTTNGSVEVFDRLLASLEIYQ